MILSFDDFGLKPDRSLCSNGMNTALAQETTRIFNMLVSQLTTCAARHLPVKAREDFGQDVLEGVLKSQLLDHALAQTTDLDGFRKYVTFGVFHAAQDATRIYRRFHQNEARTIQIEEVTDSLSVPTDPEERIFARQFWQDLGKACPEALGYERSYEFHDTTSINRRKIAKVFSDHGMPTYMLNRGQAPTRVMTASINAK